MSEFIEGLDGDLFVQADIALPFEWLSCVNLADLPLPLGDFTSVYCPDPARKGKTKVAGKIQGDPATPTTTITRPFSTVANWLLENDCPFNALATWACAGSRVIPDNYEIAAILFNCQPTNSTLLASIVRNRGDNTRLDTNAEIAYDDRVLIYHLIASAITMTNTADANNIIFLPEQCASKCADARDLCDDGYMSLDGTLYDSEIKKTHDGVNWTQTPTDAFEEGGDAGPMAIFEKYYAHRMIVGRISASTHLPAEIAWTEDRGVTWTNVDVGDVVGQFFGRHGLWPQDSYLYGCCSGGDIYRSLNLGTTWTRISTGVTAQDLNAICMYTSKQGFCVGNANAFLYTENGSDWYAGTGPAVGVNLLSVACNADGHIFVGAADGTLYVSQDDGVTWETRYAFGVGSVDWIAFDVDNRYIGGVVYNTAAPVGTFYRSIDGGASWTEAPGQTDTWNSGINAGFICDPNHFYLVGPAHDGNTFAAIVQPSGA